MLVKHEIFLGDVNNCFSLLKKAVQDLNGLGTLSEAQLQMGQPTARFAGLSTVQWTELTALIQS